MFENVNKLMDERIAMGVPGNDVVVYKDGVEVYRSWRGYSDVENKTLMSGDEYYNIYSCSKPITCVAALMLVEKGVISLEDKLSDYMPEFKDMRVICGDTTVPAKSAITIKQLFNMTAGFSYNMTSPSLMEAREKTGGRCPTVETLKYLAKEPLVAEPGTKWTYSLCHDVLAAVVEIASGMRYNEFLKKNIFEPCGMKDTTFDPTEVETERLCAQYIIEDAKLIRTAPEYNEFRFGTEYDSGGAGCATTLSDYIKFLEALRSCKLLKRETIDMMSKNIFPDAESGGYWHEGYGYGLGVRCKYKDGDGIYDFGWDGAAGAYLAVDMKHNITVFYTQQVRGSEVAYKQNVLIKKVYEDLGIEG